MRECERELDGNPVCAREMGHVLGRLCVCDREGGNVLGETVCERDRVRGNTSGVSLLEREGCKERKRRAAMEGERVREAERVE